MPSTAETLALAKQHHEAGRVRAAEALYQQLVATAPETADAWHGLGVLALQAGDLEQAIERVAQAIRWNRTEAIYHNTLGTAFSQGQHWNRAVECFRRALDLLPRYGGALHNLGNAWYKLGEFSQAVGCYQQALALEPRFAEAHFCLGLAWQAQEQWEAAAASHRRALACQPVYPEAQFELGNTLAAAKKPADAVACFQQVVAWRPDHADAWLKLGNELANLGHLDEAVAAYDRSLQIQPHSSATHNNRGIVLSRQQRYAEAIQSFDRAAEINPASAAAHANRAAALVKHGAGEEALAACDEALRLDPEAVAAIGNKGIALAKLGRFDEALVAYDRALRLRPDFAETHSNRGNTLCKLRRYPEAIAEFEQAIALQPHYAQAHFNRAYAWLLTGDWKQGWPEYEWRWLTEGRAPRAFAQPLWRGEALDGRTILLHAEQGLGDVIQFVRYVPLVHARGGKIVLECFGSLRKLLADFPHVHQLGLPGDPIPAFDVHAPLLSLPGIFQTTVDNVPANVPYLFPQPQLVDQWRRRLAEFDGLKIGIAWQGNQANVNDRFRSPPLRHFAPLAQTPGVRLFSLQKGFGAEQLNEVRDQFSVVDWTAEMDADNGPFVDTAALMKCLDLVITSDTAIAHLAGALGAPVWVALPFSPDWRWLLDRSDSPWYPTMRLFRQSAWGDWPGVFAEIAAAVRKWKPQQEPRRRKAR